MPHGVSWCSHGEGVRCALSVATTVAMAKRVSGEGATPKRIEASRRFPLPHDRRRSIESHFPFVGPILYPLCKGFENPFPATYKRGHLFCLWRPPR